MTMTNTPAGEKQRSLNSILVLIVVAAIVIVAFQPYYFGYRLSRDDVWFFMASTEGFWKVWDHASSVAVDQGRIGQIFMLPLNVLGAFLVGDPAWRVAFLALYVLQLLLFAIFVSRLLRQDITLFLFLLLVALHPLAFENMPPNAYPLQNTLPFIVVLAARLIVIRQRQREVPSRAQILFAQIAFMIGMFVSEFVVALGTGLLIAEYLARFQWGREAGSGWKAALRSAFARRYLVSDGLAVLIVLVPYGIFRWFNPSLYEGNSVGSLLHIRRLLGTAFGHIKQGTPLRFLDQPLPPLEGPDVWVAVAFGIVVAACLYYLSGPVLRIRTPWAVAVVAFLLTIYVSLPIAISAKYQIECMDWSKCGYLDSRMSYLPAAATLMGIIAIIGQLPFRRVFIGAICIATGAVATLVSLHNAVVADDMRRYDAVWNRGETVACASPQLIGDEPAFMATVDPEALVELHPPSSPLEFWRVYIPWRADGRCRIK